MGVVRNVDRNGCGTECGQEWCGMECGQGWVWYGMWTGMDMVWNVDIQGLTHNCCPIV